MVYLNDSIFKKHSTYLMDYGTFSLNLHLNFELQSISNLFFGRYHVANGSNLPKRSTFCEFGLKSSLLSINTSLS